jgi:hypothetical protein
MKFKENYQIIQFNNYKQHLDKETIETLSHVFNSEGCKQLINESCWSFQAQTLYNPLKTLLIFIKQVLSSDKSCKNAVCSVIVNELSQSGVLVGSSTGAYVKARQRLPGMVVHELVKLVGTTLVKKSPDEWMPYGRDLKVFDGTTITMPDTEANVTLFPKHSNQNKNVGFPLARLVAVMSLTTGSIIDYAIGPCKGKGTGEASLLRRILDCIQTNDIVLGDRYYPHFFLMCDLKRKGVDGVFRGAAQRCYDFRQGKRLGKYDHIAAWKKPLKPEWMSIEEYKSYPDTLHIREFKEAGAIYVTTFLDSEKYTKKDLSLLYKRRWEVETNLNFIKTVMAMNRLTCKTPAMVEKEIGIHFLAYNMIRNLMVQASVKHKLRPAQISFKGTIQLLNQFSPLLHNVNEQEKIILYEYLLDFIAKNKVGNRPGRVEPRAVRQRPKSFPVLKQTRKIEQKKLLLMNC